MTKDEREKRRLCHDSIDIERSSYRFIGGVGNNGTRPNFPQIVWNKPRNFERSTCKNMRTRLDCSSFMQWRSPAVCFDVRTSPIGLESGCRWWSQAPLERTRCASLKRQVWISFWRRAWWHEENTGKDHAGSHR